MISNITGALGIGANVAVYQQKSGKKLLISKLISDFLWAFHYFSLNATSAAAIAVIAIFRETIFFNQDKKWAKSKLWLIFFLLCSVVSAVLTWRGVISTLPAIASILSVLSFWKGSPRLTRYLAFPISACMLSYNIFYHSYMGIVNEVLTLFSAAFGVIRFYKTKENS